MKQYTSGLGWLSLTTILPLVLMTSLILGRPLADRSSLFGLTTGIVAFSWMLAGLFLAVQSRFDKGSGFLAQASLLIASLPLSLGHAVSNPSQASFSALTGRLALMAILAVGIYSLMFWLLTQFKPSRRISPRLVKWATALNLVAVSLTVAHLQLIDHISQNTLFMATVYGILFAIAGLYASRFLPKAQQQEA